MLAACSNYFQSLFMENTCKHPIVFLKVKFCFTKIYRKKTKSYLSGHSVQPDQSSVGLHVSWGGEQTKLSGKKLNQNEDKQKMNHNNKSNTKNKTTKEGGKMQFKR